MCSAGDRDTSGRLPPDESADDPGDTAVHENIQPLADGKRIVRRQQSERCRDGDESLPSGLTLPPEPGPGRGPGRVRRPA